MNAKEGGKDSKEGGQLWGIPWLESSMNDV